MAMQSSSWNSFINLCRKNIIVFYLLGACDASFFVVIKLKDDLFLFIQTLVLFKLIKLLILTHYIGVKCSFKIVMPLYDLIHSLVLTSYYLTHIEATVTCLLEINKLFDHLSLPLHMINFLINEWHQRISKSFFLITVMAEVDPYTMINLIEDSAAE